MEVTFKNGLVKNFKGNEYRNISDCSFTGWVCSAPSESLNINADGKLESGICRSVYFGNIYRGHLNISKNNETVCRRPFCTAIPDIICSKKPRDNIESNIKSISPSKNVLNINWDLSRKCNFNCEYCSSEFHQPGARFESLATYLYGWSNLEKFILNRDSLVDKEIYLSILGGEPTLFGDLNNLLHNINLNPSLSRLTVLTNGSQSLKYYKKLVTISNIVFSIHFKFIKQASMINKIMNLYEFSQQNNLNSVKVKIMTMPGKVKRSINFRNELLKSLKLENIETLMLREPNAFPPKFYNYSEEELKLLAMTSEKSIS